MCIMTIKKGFEGLNTLEDENDGSLDDIIKSAHKEIKKAETKKHVTQESHTNSDTSTMPISRKVQYPTTTGDNNKPKFMIWIAIAISVFAFFIYINNDKSGTSTSSQNSYVKPETIAVQHKEYSKPPTVAERGDKYIFSIGELRWLSQRRAFIEELRPLIEGTRTQKGVSEFRKLVKDYNARVKGQYYNSDKEIVDMEMKIKAEKIHFDAVTQARAWGCVRRIVPMYYGNDYDENADSDDNEEDETED